MLLYSSGCSCVASAPPAAPPHAPPAMGGTLKEGKDLWQIGGRVRVLFLWYQVKESPAQRGFFCPLAVHWLSIGIPLVVNWYTIIIKW